ncbi:MAG: aldehyde dehydrogenase family protein, partial [Methanoregulaceae archaeon]|nr:aldehyde dehydrogenase family protein [Methanoregulaceae archaeon]
MTENTKVTYVSLLDDKESHRKYEQALRIVEGELGEHHPLFISGKEMRSAEEFEVRSPVDRSLVIGYFQAGGEDEARRAIEAGKSYFPQWNSTDWRSRVKKVRDTAVAIDRDMFNLAALMAFEIGKTRTEALAEVGEASDMLRYYCDVYEKNEGFSLPMASPAPGERCMSILKPHGLWAVISPFNFPLALAAGMISGALLTGNTVVFKPTSAAVFSGLRLYQAFIKGRVPPEALQFVTGPGSSFGNVVVSHPDVGGIAFTGSRAVGRWLTLNFADKQAYEKPLVAEMGSKNPVIVSSKADLSDAVEGVVRSAFGYGGQKCSATSRVYVQETIKDV